MLCRAAAAVEPPSRSRVRLYGYSSRVAASRSRVSRGSGPKASSHRYRLASKSLTEVAEEGKGHVMHTAESPVPRADPWELCYLGLRLISTNFMTFMLPVGGKTKWTL